MQINFIDCITQLFLVSKNGNGCFSCNSAGFCFLCGHLLIRLRSGEAIFRWMTAAEGCASCLSLGTITPALLHQVLSPCTALSELPKQCHFGLGEPHIQGTHFEPLRVSELIMGWFHHIFLLSKFFLCSLRWTQVFLETLASSCGPQCWVQRAL